MAESGWTERFTMDGVPYYFNEVTEAVCWDKPDSLKSLGELETESGRWRWVPDDRLAWIPARESLKLPDGKVECLTEDGRTVTLPKNAPDWPLMRSSLQHLEEDLVLVDNMNEGLIIHNLRERFAQDKIYTNIGTILVSVNPFKRLPLYTPSVIEQYFQSGGNKRLPPHIFGIADSAYKSMLYEKRDQSILISGESGAGKTEATKQCLTFFAEVAGSESNVEQKIIQANPILEAFGNAKTVRNNNSSRFGKYMEIHFDKNGKIVGARTENYLLEKSRVVYQSKGERNYHIFYQLCKGHLAQKYHCNLPLESFPFFGSQCYDVDDVDDVQEFKEVCDSMEILGFSENEIDWLFSTVAAVLHLGNVKFTSNNAEDLAKIANPDEIGVIAKLLKVKPQALAEAVTSRWFVIKGQDPTKIPFKVCEARDSCDALAKAIYGRTFDWLVQRINKSVEVQGGQSWKFIGVLDIFGFEIFEMNSFEQLCINFANEKLQQHFNQYTFKLEEQVYQSEKINFTHIEFIDNQPILDLIEKRPNGLLVLLDEEIVMPKGSDSTWSRKIVQLHSSSNYFEKIIQKDTAFIIHHYAGAVRYDADGFLVKNKDTLYQDLYDLLHSSSEKYLSDLFPPIDVNDRKRVSLGGQFRKQLNDLMEKLNQTQPHYVRCVKPNSLKRRDDFNSIMSLEQLRYAGVFEAIKIRQSGYPFRYSHTEFVRRYKCLALKDNGWLPLKSKDDKSLCQELLKISKQDFSDVQIGLRQVLYRAEHQRILELLRNLSLEKVSVVVQNFLRMMLAQIFTRRMFKVRPPLREAIQIKHDLVKTEKALNNASTVIGSIKTVFGFQMYEITYCKDLRLKLLERKRVSDLLAYIFPQDPEENFDELSDIVRQADEIEEYPANKDQLKLYKDTKAKLQLTIDRRATRATLKSGTEAADKYVINDAIERAIDLGIENCREVATARQMLKRIADEEKIIANLDNALNTGCIVTYSDGAQRSLDIVQLDKVITEAAKFDMKTADGVYKLALARFSKKLRTLLASVEWMGCRPWLTVEELMNGAEFQEEFMQHPEVSWASHETAYRNRRREVLEPLKVAIDTLNEDGLDKGTSRFEEQLNIGADQMQRLWSLQQEISAAAAESLAKVKNTRELLEKALRSDDEDDLKKAVNTAQACPVTNQKAVALQEKFASAKILLAMKFHIAQGVREEIGLMLDETLAAATSAKVKQDSQSVVELKKDTIINELKVQSGAINEALNYASSVEFKTEDGQTVLEKGKVIKGLRDSLMARDWDQVEFYLNQAGSLQIETPDVDLARDEVAGRAAAEDVLAKIEQAVYDVPTPSDSVGHPSEGILQTCLAQAERLQMKELDTIKDGRNMLNQIRQTRNALQQALKVEQYDDAVNLAEEFNQLYGLFDNSSSLLKSSIQMSEGFQYDTKEVRSARHLLDEIGLLRSLQVGMNSGGYYEGDEPSSNPGDQVQVDTLSQAYEPVEGFNLTTDLSHYIVLKSYHIIVIRGALQVASEDHSHLAAGLQDSSSLGSETPEITSAAAYLKCIETCIAKMAEAEEKVVQALLEDAVKTCEYYFYENENVQRVRELRDLVIELNEESRQALWNMDKDRMQDVYNRANAIRLSTPHFEKIGALLSLSEEDFIKLEIKKAKESDDDARKTWLTIRLKEITLDHFGNMFGILQYKNLRTPKDYAAQKLVTTERKKLAMGMMYWSKVPIHTSLTDLQDPLHLKLARKAFKNILGFMGDKKYPFPTTLAQELIQFALDNPPIRSEIYCQIIKQLNEHPVPQNQHKGRELLALCCYTFPPSADFENFLEMYLRNVPQASSKYIAALRDVQYGGTNPTAPNPDQLDAFVKDFYDPLKPTGESKFQQRKPIKTSQYTQQFFDDPQLIFLANEVDLYA